MIDIHTHLLPGVDDGSRSIEESVGCLAAFVLSGVTTVVCTPHLKASKVAAAPFMDHAQLLNELRAAAPLGIQLLSGWEIMLDLPRVDLADPRLALGTSTAVLVEFQHTTLPPNSTEELYRIRRSGAIPIVAHPERYHGCTVDDVKQWRSVGAIIQMDVTAILGARRIGEFSRELLRQGLCDIFASDTHVDSRSLAPVRDWLTEHGSTEHADLLTQVNAERVLADRPTIPVPPLATDVGGVQRLWQMLFGKKRKETA